MKRLEQQIEFIKEIDKLKEVYRRSYLLSQTRKENSAEHSWHIALMAMLLSEYSNTEVNLPHVVEMLLVHDIIEIDAGDTYCYDEIGYMDKDRREQQAADRIFSLLPQDQADRLINLWREFEAAETPESKFANSVDRLMPLIHNFNTSGRSWKEHGITKKQVSGRTKKIAEGSETLWKYAEQSILKAVEEGLLKDEL
jgi:putative hydrolase of HD superfamily